MASLDSQNKTSRESLPLNDRVDLAFGILRTETERGLVAQMRAALDQKQAFGFLHNTREITGKTTVLARGYANRAITNLDEDMAEVVYNYFTDYRKPGYYKKQNGDGLIILSEGLGIQSQRKDLCVVNVQYDVSKSDSSGRGAVWHFFIGLSKTLAEQFYKEVEQNIGDATYGLRILAHVLGEDMDINCNDKDGHSKFAELAINKITLKRV